MVEEVYVCFCSDQSSDKADLGNEDGEAKEKGEAGSKDQQVSSHLKKWYKMHSFHVSSSYND